MGHHLVLRNGFITVFAKLKGVTGIQVQLGPRTGIGGESGICSCFSLYFNILRMMGTEPDGPALMLGDNKSVVLNCTMPHSVLKKKHAACNYHRVREAIAGKVINFSHIPSEYNYADILTKPVPGETFRRLVKPLLFRVPKEEE